MDLQDWAAIVEIVGGGTLVLMLAGLLLQARAAERTARQAVRTQHMAAWRDANLRSTQNQTVTAAIDRAGQTVTEDVDEQEMLIWVHDILAFLIQAQSDFDAWRAGVLDNSDFDCLVRQRLVLRFNVHPRMAISWSRYRGMFKPEFAGFVDEFIGEISERVAGRGRDLSGSDQGSSERSWGASDWIANARRTSATRSVSAH